MADFTPVLATQSRLNQIPITEGQFICVYDTGRMFVDHAGGRYQQCISIVSDSQSLPAQPTDKFCFVKSTNKLLYYANKWNEVNSNNGLIRQLVDQNISAQPNHWYLCTQNITVELPLQSQYGDIVKVSTISQADNVQINAASNQYIQSDSSFLLDAKNNAVEFIYTDNKWLIAEVIAN